MITRSQNFNGCGNKIFLDCESDAYQSVKRQNDYRITKLDYNEATGILSISQNPDVTKFTNIGDNSVTSNTFRSHLDAIEYILDYNKFKKSGTSKFDKCSNYLVYNQYAEADKKYIYFTYSQNANRWYEISLNEGDEFYDKLKNVKYRYHNGRLVNVVDVKLTKSQDRVGDRGTNITLSVEPSTSKGVVIPVVDEYNAGLMHPNDFRRFKDINSELVGSFNIVDVDNNHWKLELVNKNGEVITSILIDKDNDNYLHDVEAVITNGRRTLNFQMYDKTGPTTIYNVDLEDWFDYTGVETSSIKVEVNDNDEISANLKISSDKDNTLSLDNEGLVSILKWLDGDRINFKLGTEVDYDSKVFENVIYFATDTKNIIINGNKYGIDFNDNDIDLVSKIEFTDTIGEFKITNTNGEIYTLSLPLATSDYNGLMSAEDKKKLSTLANTSISQISKVFRDGQQGLEIIISDIVANQTRTIFIPFSEVDRENNGLMSIADKIKLDNVDIIVNEINPFELEDEQFGTRLVYTVRDYRDPSNPVDITKYQELPLVQNTSSGLMPKEYKIKSDRILMYLQSVNTELTKTVDTNTITFIEYNPNNDQSREVLVTFDEVTETEAGLLGAIDKVKLNRIVDYLISIEPETTKTENTQVININRYNPNTNETVVDNVTITEATNEHAGLLTSIEHSKLEDITDYVNDLVDTSNTEDGRDINYTKYDSDLHEITEHSILIPNATQTENGLQSSQDKIKEDNITTYPREFQDAVSDDQGVNIAYKEYQPSDATNVSSKINIKLATQTENGVMSSVDKVRVDNAPQDAYTDISLDVTEDNYTIVTEQKDRDSGEITTTRLDLPIANDNNRGIISKETNKGLNHNYIESLSQNVNSDSINILSKNTNPLTNVTTEDVPNITLQSATRDTAGIITSEDYQRFDNIPQTIEYNTDANFSEDKYQVNINVKDIDNNTESVNTIDFPLVSKTNRGLQSKEDKIKSDNIIDYVDEVNNFVTSDEGIVSTVTHYNPSNGDTRESTITINNATSTENGSMSALDKVRIDNIPTNTQSDVEYNFTEDKYQVTYTNVDTTSGEESTETIDFPLASDTNRGLLSKEANQGLNKEYLTNIASENLEDKVEIIYTKNNILNNGEDVNTSIDIDLATQELSGVMSPTDKIRVDNLPNLHLVSRKITPTATDIKITDNNININTGDSQDIIYSIPSATNGTAGLMTPALYDKLIKVDIDGMVNTIDRIFIEDVEQKPDSLKDVYLDTYSTSTIDDKFQNISDNTNETIENLDKELNNRIDSEVETINTRITTEVNTINSTITELENKHDQDVADINSSITDLTNKHNQDITTINNNIDELETKHDNDVTSINQSIEDLNTKHDQDIAQVNQDISDLEAKHDAFVATKNQPGGFPSLDESGLVPSNQLPSYVDDVIEVYATYDKDEVGDLSNVQLYADPEHQTPITGETGKIYVNITEGEPNYNFRWSGTQFSPIDTGGLILGEITGTAYDGGKGKHLSDIADSLPEYIVTGVIRNGTLADSITLAYNQYKKQSDGTYARSGMAQPGIPASTTTAAGAMTANDRKLANQLDFIGKVGHIFGQGFSSTEDTVTLHTQTINTTTGNTDSTESENFDLPAASSTSAGTMSAADKVKLDNLDTTIGDSLEEAKQYTDSKVGDLDFSSSNYVSDATNVTEAITNLDNQAKTNANNITNLQNDLNTLDEEAVKGVKVGNNSNTEAFADNIVTIRNASKDNDGTLSKEIYKNLDEIPYAYGIDLGDNNGFMQIINLRRKDLLTGTNDYVTATLVGASDSRAGLLTSADKTKLDNLSSSLETSIEDAVNQAKEYADATFLPLSGGTMTGPIGIPYNGIQTPSGNRLIFYNDNELWFGHENYRGVWETSNTDLLHRKNDTNYTILDTSNFVAGTDYLAPGTVTIADINDLGSTWDSYLKAGVYDRNITVNGTAYPVMTDVSGATAINIYAPTTAGTSGQFLKSTGGTPSWNSITVADISNLNSTWDAFMTGSNLDTRNILINGSAWTVYSSVGTDTTRIYAPTTMSTNSDQVLTGSSDSIPKWGYPNVVSVHDIRGTAPTPDEYTNMVAKFYFTNMELPDGISTWTSKLSVKGWSNGYNVWELAGGSSTTLCEHLAFRAGIGDNWGDWHEIAFQDWTTTQLGNYLPLTGGTLTGALHFAGSALPEATTTDFFLCMNAFNSGGQVKYINASNVLAAIGGVSSSSLNNYLPLTAGSTKPLTGTLFAYGSVNSGINGYNLGLIVGNGTTTKGMEIRSQNGVLGFGAHEDGIIRFWRRYSDDDTQYQGYFVEIDAANGGFHHQTNMFMGLNSHIALSESSFLRIPASSTGACGITNSGVSESLNNLSLYFPGNTSMVVGNTNYTLLALRTNTTSNLVHRKGTSDYTIYDAGNTFVRSLSFNGGNQDCLTTVQNPTKLTWYAPTLAGTSGQILQSTGGVPTWTGDNFFRQSRKMIASADLDTFASRVSGTYAVDLGGSSAILTVFARQMGSTSALEFYSNYTMSDFRVRTTIDDNRYNPWKYFVLSNSGTENIANYAKLSGDSFKPNNMCWGGTKTDGTTVCLAFISPEDIALFGHTSLPLKLRSSSNPTVAVGSNTYTLLHTGNFGSITFTGAATGTFNGTNDLTINIPQGGGTADSVAWANVTGKPSTFTPSAHNHSASNITSGTLALARIPTGTTSSTVALGNHTHETLVARYSGSGGVIAPSEVGTNVLRCRMMYANPASTGGGYCDWLLMNAYTWSDVPYCTGIGVLKAATPRAFIMSGPNSSDKADWNRLELATQSWVISHGYLTSSSLVGYATQSWVTSQINGLDAADIGAAAASHTHVFGDITFNNTGTNRQYLAGDGKFYTIAYSEVSDTPDLSNYASSSHTHGTDDIVYLTGYTEGTSTTTLHANMTLNLALASLQNQIQTKQAAGNYATESYVDDAVANVSIDTSGFVTLTGTQTISGAKTFTHSNGVRSTYGFYDISDIRLKSNIQDIELKDKINFYEFDKQGKHSYGVIAQEVEQIYPSVVNTDENGYKTVNYNEVLSIKCAELEAENKELKARLDKLEALVNSLL